MDGMESALRVCALGNWSLSRKGRFDISFVLPDDVRPQKVDVLIAQREDGSIEWSPEDDGLTHRIPATPSASSPHEYSANVDLSQLQWHDARWAIIALVTHATGETEGLLIQATTRQRLRFYRNAIQAYLPGDAIVIPYLNSRRSISLIYRERRWYDSPWYHAKEVVAWATYKAFKGLFARRRIWIVYEKQCERAQDNGFYFFEWCMRELPPRERKRIYYVIDRHSPDYDRVKQYGRQVLPFMSFRHFLYCMGAEMLVGSETKIHLSPYRSRPSYMKHKLAKTMTFFLQHGVMAFKRTDKRMGATGWHPVDYFLVSSEAEQDVITGNFGYDAEHVPVLGQARWDVLEDHSDKVAPRILLMPTWREWLSDSSDDEFRATDFYVHYDRLFRDPRLAEVLEAHNATLQVFFHPLFLERAHLFASDNPRIQIIKPGEMPLNQIIMGCSAMITDYSSAVWDAVYQDKPALFFHFDRPLYMEKTGSYIDFETELPGDCYLDAEGLVQGIRDIADGGFVPSARQEAVSRRWFAHRDHDNRKRIYECALEIERSIGE